jgi:hypothetical protein
MDLQNTSLTRLRKKIVGDSGFQFYGRQRTRRIFEQIQRNQLDPSFLVISDGSKVNTQELSQKLDVPEGVPFGWIGFSKIKKMKGIPESVCAIEENLKI